MKTRRRGLPDTPRSVKKRDDAICTKPIKSCRYTSSPLENRRARSFVRYLRENSLKWSGFRKRNPASYVGWKGLILQSVADVSHEMSPNENERDVDVSSNEYRGGGGLNESNARNEH